jgi:hypothetical protein
MDLKLNLPAMSRDCRYHPCPLPPSLRPGTGGCILPPHCLMVSLSATRSGLTMVQDIMQSGPGAGYPNLLM